MTKDYGALNRYKEESKKINILHFHNYINIIMGHAWPLGYYIINFDIYIHQYFTTGLYKILYRIIDAQF